MGAISAPALGSLVPPPAVWYAWHNALGSLHCQARVTTHLDLGHFPTRRSHTCPKLHSYASWQGLYLKGRKVRKSRRTRRTPRILAPPAEATDTTISMMDTKTRKPSSTFQLLRKYACSPKYRPRETTWGQG